jgi:aminoglycoside phosphotransferase (APT) family kinase protein
VDPERDPDLGRPGDPDRREESRVIDALRDFVNARLPELRPGAAPVEGIVLAGPDKAPASNVTFFVFDRNRELAAVAKVGRDPAYDGRLGSEYATLRELRGSGDAAFAASVPEALALTRIGGRTVLLLSAMDGRPLMTDYYAPGHVGDPARVGHDFSIAGAWLASLHVGSSRGRITFGQELFDRWIGATFDRYRTVVGWNDAEERIYELVRERARALYGTHLPVTALHGDFWMGNILVKDGTISGVVDWERANLAAPPFTDIYKFPTSYGFYMDRGYPELDGRVPGHPERDVIASEWTEFGSWPNLIGFAYTYFGAGWFPSLVRRFVAGSLDRLHVPDDVNGVFFPAFLAQEATTVRDEAFRHGYRSLLAALEHERDSSWLWTAGVTA